MRSISRSAACMTLLAGACLPACWAQKWEVGVMGGGGFYTHASVTGPASSGTVGFKPGAAFGAFLGNNTSNKWGGELHYTYQPGKLKVSSGGSEATFNGESHAINYDFLYHFAPMEAHVRPFVAFGGGVKLLPRHRRADRYAAAQQPGAADRHARSRGHGQRRRGFQGRCLAQARVAL